jgi:hypothetical protein
MIKHAIIVASLVSGIALSGCNGTLDPATQADVNTAFTTLCSSLPIIQPVSTKLNATVQADYATAVQICSMGSPTNAVTAGLDVLAVYEALSPYFSKATALAPEARHSMKRIDADIAAGKFVGSVK